MKKITNAVILLALLPLMWAQAPLTSERKTEVSEPASKKNVEDASRRIEQSIRKTNEKVTDRINGLEQIQKAENDKLQQALTATQNKLDADAARRAAAREEQKKTTTIVIVSSVLLLLAFGGLILFMNHRRSQNERDAIVKEVAREVSLAVAQQPVEALPVVQQEVLIDPDIPAIYAFSARNNSVKVVPFIFGIQDGRRFNATAYLIPDKREPEVLIEGDQKRVAWVRRKERAAQIPLRAVA